MNSANPFLKQMQKKVMMVPYTVSSSEKLRKSVSETETKAMFYLMNFYEDSDVIYYFVVDFLMV